jgi:transitional endoplasmic reticulum ATPase
MIDDTQDAAETRADLEQRLLLAPFDAALRTRYAERLLSEGDWPAAAAQARLLVGQWPDQAAGHALSARARQGQGDLDGARADYLAARRCADFQRIDALEALLPPPVPGQGGRLQLVGAAPAPAVRALQQVSPEKVRFSSIVGMDDLKKTIRLKIIDPYLKPGLFARFKMNSGGGILLYGPPGCGKTMMARAIANECQAEFIPVGISDVLNMWLGESERNLAAMFDKARANTPAVLFFDELDALAFSRAKASAASTRSVVNEFLSQLDGIGRENQGVLVLAATNMPWDVDDAMKRPGRFSRQIFVSPPDEAARREMLRIKLTGVPCDGIDLDAVARATANYSGADIDGLIELAKESAVSEAMDDQDRALNAADFDWALRQMQSSTLEWLRTVRNVVKYAGDDGTYREVGQYLKRTGML